MFCMPNLTPSSIPSKILDIWRKNYCYQGHQVVKDPSHHKDLQFTLLVQAQLTKQLPGIACGNCAAWTALAASMLHDVRVLCLFPQHSGTFGEDALQCFGLIPILRKTSCKSPSRPKNCATGVTGRIAPKSTHALSSYGIGDQARL